MFNQITTSSEQEVIGVKNGIFQLEFEDKELKKNSNYDEICETLMFCDIESFLENQNKISSLNISNIKGKLLKKAKLTDIISFSPYFFGYKYIVNEKFVDCLTDLNVNNEEYHLREIEIEDVVEKYYLLFIPLVSTSEINFKESLIYPESDMFSEKKTYFNINNFQEYSKLLETSLFNKWDKITLSEKFKNKDIINLQASTELFFSERLINKLKEKNISNIVYRENNILSFTTDAT